MTDKTIIEKLEVHTDARGTVYEPLQGDQFLRQANAHLVMSRPGAVRGNHYHRKGTETVAVTGPALVRIREADILKDIHLEAGEVYRFVFPPGVSHAIRHTGSADGVLVAFNTVLHDRMHPDVVADLLIPTGDDPL